MTGSLNKQLGGVTYSKRGVKRMRVIPNNPRTTLQTQTRQAFSFLTTEWANLTDVQRQAWETARLDPYYFVPNDFYGGTKAATSGKSLFIQINFNLLQKDDMLGSPYVVTTDPAGVEPLDSFTVISVVADASADTLVLTYSQTGTNEKLVVRTTPPVSPGTMRLKSVESKLRDSLVLSASPATTSKPASYTGLTGQKVFYVIEAIGDVSGKKRIIASGSTTIVA